MLIIKPFLLDILTSIDTNDYVFFPCVSIVFSSINHILYEIKFSHMKYLHASDLELLE